MKLKVVVIAGLLLSLLLGGCGTQRRATQKAERLRTENGKRTGEEKSKDRQILYPEGYEKSDDYAQEDEHYRVPVVEGARKQTTFTQYESTNIRVVGINPLPTGGVLELNLDQMRNDFCYPYDGEFISDYGIRGRAMHTGVDIRTVPNDTIRAAFGGVVRMSRMYSSYGNMVVIQHDHGFETLYSHNSKNLVDVNDIVKAGDPIALGGRTGRATTEHVHFEVRIAGEHVDPNKLIDVQKRELQRGMLYLGLVDGDIIAYTSDREAKQSIEQERIEQQKRRESEAIAAEQRAVVVAEAEKKAVAAQEYHKVQSGDTLYGIARRHNTTVKRLCEINNIKESAILQLNQRLRVK